MPGYFVTGKTIMLFISVKWLFIGLIALVGTWFTIRQQERFEEQSTSYDRWFKKVVDDHNDDPEAVIKITLDEIGRFKKKQAVFPWLGGACLLAGTVLCAYSLLR